LEVTQRNDGPPLSERQAMIARARQAAERAQAGAGNSAKPAIDKARSSSEITIGGKGAILSGGIVRPGVILVAIAAIAFAGYWFLIGQKQGLPRPLASTEIEHTTPVVSSPAATAPVSRGSQPDIDTSSPTHSGPQTEPRSGLSKSLNEGTDALPVTGQQEASRVPDAGEAAGPGMAVAFGSSPATYDSVMQARERARMANLSQQTAFEAVRSKGAQPAVPTPAQPLPPASPAPVSAQAVPVVSASLPQQVRTTSAIETASTPRAGTTASMSAMLPAAALTSQLPLPPATTGPLSLRLAAANGDSAAQLEIATRLAEGKGVKQNFAEAAKWYERSAEQGQPIAQYRLATLYERGMGVKPDRSKAQELYVQAAQRGNLKAMHNLAVISANPAAGAPDYDAAAKLFDRAARHGLHDSQYNLGVLYESGLGVPKDHAAAYKWYTLAATGGDTEAARRRDMLISRLPSETLQAMEVQIAAWRPEPSDESANNSRVVGSSWSQNSGATRVR